MIPLYPKRCLALSHWSDFVASTVSDRSKTDFSNTTNADLDRLLGEVAPAVLSRDWKATVARLSVANGSLRKQETVASHAPADADARA